MKRRFLIAVSALCALAFVVSLVYLYRDQLRRTHATQSIAALQQQVAAPSDASGEMPAQSPDALYGTLKQENSDMVAWISITGTPINYPVMQTTDYFYLNRGFDKKQSIYGLPFADPACKEPATQNNIIVYAHNMKDGSMFAALKNYEQADYQKAHPLIRFDTMQNFGYYRVAAVLKTNASVQSPNSFDLSRYAQFEDSAAFESFSERLQSLSLYETGVSIAQNTPLLILSTCEYSAPNGRMVIVATRLPEAESNALRQTMS